MSTRFKYDYKGAGEILRGPEMLGIVTGIGERGLGVAKAESPVKTGEYSEGWRLELSSHGGPKGDRAEAKVVNDAGDRVLADVVDGYDVPAKVIAAIEAL